MKKMNERKISCYLNNESDPVYLQKRKFCEFFVKYMNMTLYVSLSIAYANNTYANNVKKHVHNRLFSIQMLTILTKMHKIALQWEVTTHIKQRSSTFSKQRHTFLLNNLWNSAYLPWQTTLRLLKPHVKWI